MNFFFSPLHLQEVFFSMKHNKTTYRSVKLIKKKIQFLNFNINMYFKYANINDLLLLYTFDFFNRL